MVVIWQVDFGRGILEKESPMKTLEDAKEGRGGLIIHFSPRTLRAMWNDFDRIMKSDDYDYDFKRFVQNIMDEISERHIKLTEVEIRNWKV